MPYDNAKRSEYASLLLRCILEGTLATAGVFLVRGWLPSKLEVTPLQALMVGLILTLLNGVNVFRRKMTF